jgi:ankyrin repeat protein
MSRAGSPIDEMDGGGDGPVHDIEYSLESVVQESSRWVVDKNAGETILHRAAKMGYPDIVAYAVDRLDMAVMDKDYAGLTPLHKAAFKGHEGIVRLLLKYGADPSAGVKGTRALHEGRISFQF